MCSWSIHAVIPGVDIRCHAFSHQYRVNAHYKCPKAKAVWKIVIGDWNEKAGDQVSTADVTVAVAGLRTCPDGVSGEAKSEWERLEPAWRLLHALSLIHI